MPRLHHATNDAMRAILSDETPYFCRRAIDKSCYEVGRADNEDWREVISDEQTILSRHPTYEKARLAFDRLEFDWRYSALLEFIERHEARKVARLTSPSDGGTAP
jgi:hypothetical protein